MTKRCQDCLSIGGWKDFRIYEDKSCIVIRDKLVTNNIIGRKSTREFNDCISKDKTDRHPMKTMFYLYCFYFLRKNEEQTYRNVM
jgi:hypothetical protein